MTCPAPLQVYRFRYAHLWSQDPPSYHTEGRFVTWSHHVPPSVWGGGPPSVESHLSIVAHHLLSLRNAFAVARALNRTVIVPKLLCHCDWYYYPMSGCRTPGSEVR